MTTATITKTINKLNVLINTSEYSLGFNRLSVLPSRVRRALDLAIYLKTESINTHSFKVDFFQKMNEQEYINYLKTA
jgi:hypothetical protein